THPEQIRYLVSQGCIKPLCDFLSCSDSRIILVILEAIEHILYAGREMAAFQDDNVNHYALHIEEAGGLQTIYELQHHNSNEVYRKSKDIIDQFFSDED